MSIIGSILNKGKQLISRDSVRKEMNKTPRPGARMQDNTPVIEVEPDKNCKICSGRGQIRKIPRPGQHSPFHDNKGNVRIAEMCNCVIKRAAKKATAQGLQGWDRYRISVKATMKMQRAIKKETPKPTTIG